MLLNLTITNFAIIDHLEVQFDTGFNVLTGETGAGKSIILDAVGLLLGDRARPDLVRAGADEATVQALFELSGQDDVRKSFAEAGFPVDEELVLRRIVQGGGRSRAYINGNLATLAQLQPLTEQLVTICGQHEHQHLLQRNVHLAILDRFGLLDGQVQTYRQSYQKMQDVARQLQQLEDAERDREQRLDFLQHQSAEIADAELSVEEEQALLAERLLLQNAERLVAVARGGYDALYDSDGSVCEVLGSLSTDLQAVAEVDKKLATLSETVQRNLFELEDVAVQMRSYLTNASFEPDRIDAVEERLGLLNRLKRKYAPTIGEILELKEAYDREIVQLENAGETRVSLLEELAALKKQTGSLGQSLSAMRSKAAATLARALVAELGDLAMSGASFEVALTDLEQPGPDGLERLEFMVSLNPGEPLMPLTRVASGGELSRLMLALRRIAPDAGLVPTIIFDEIDAGVSGEVADMVGQILARMGKYMQVVNITHLPQVASRGTKHYHVYKDDSGESTITRIKLLSADERIMEVARLLSGSEITATAMKNARELLQSARN